MKMESRKIWEVRWKGFRAAHWHGSKIPIVFARGSVKYDALLSDLEPRGRGVRQGLASVGSRASRSRSDSGGISNRRADDHFDRVHQKRFTFVFGVVEVAMSFPSRASDIPLKTAKNRS